MKHVVMTAKVTILFANVLMYFTTVMASFEQLQLNENVTLPENNQTANVNGGLRLPTAWQPSVYKLDLKVYVPAGNYHYAKEKNFTIEGSLAMTLRCRQSTNVITLHQVGLSIYEPVLLTAIDGGRTFGSTRVKFLTAVDMLALEFDHFCREGSEYSVKLNYTGRIPAQGSLTGIYASSYVENAATKWFVATQMSPNDCRKLLPLFDEPMFKAVYDLTISHPTGTTALANGQQLKQESLDPYWTKTTFERSLNMSSYLIAICVTQFSSKGIEIPPNSIRKIPITLKVWSRPDMINKTTYAREITPKLLTFLEEYFGIPFPLPKLAIVALPNFGPHAMENWGLINYRESSILYDDSFSLQNKQDILETVGHELAHQWFGNLVTMKWWGDLYLKEGFATFLQYLAGDIVTNNSFHLDEQFVSGAIGASMEKDQLANSHPLRINIETNEDLFGIFDSISYQKGASVVYMVNKVVGERNFRSGLSVFLRKYAFTNADSEDMWRTISDAVAGENEGSSSPVLDWNGRSLVVSDFAAGWTLQMGYPVVTVREVSSVIDVDDADQSSNRRFSVTQARFKLDPQSTDKYNSSFGYLWKIPLSYTVGHGDSPALNDWLVTKQKIISTNETGYILIDPDSFGYFRVNYEDSNWLLIRGQLLEDINAISSKTRGRLIQDAFTLARGNLLSYKTVLKFIQFLKTESNYLGWAAALSDLHLMESYFRYTDAYDVFKIYMMTLINHKYSESYWGNVDENILTQKLHKMMLQQNCYYGHEKCLTRAKRELVSLTETCSGDMKFSDSQCNKIAPILRPTVYCYGVRAGSDFIWKTMWLKYLNESSQLEKSRILNGLSCTKEPRLIKRLINEAVNGTNIASQDITTILYHLASKAEGARIVWEYFEANYTVLKQRFGENKFQFGKLIRIATPASLFKTRAMVDKLKSLSSVYPDLSNYDSYDLALENAETHVEWMNKHYQPLYDWFMKDTSDFVGF